MQLFSIGLWKLNPDGSQMLDANGHPIPTYSTSALGFVDSHGSWRALICCELFWCFLSDLSKICFVVSSFFIFFTKARHTARGNDDIMNFARVFTGFDQQRDRGNMEDLDGQNRMDPMQMKAVWRMVPGNLRNPSLRQAPDMVKWSKWTIEPLCLIKFVHLCVWDDPPNQMHQMSATSSTVFTSGGLAWQVPKAKPPWRVPGWWLSIVLGCRGASILKERRSLLLRWQNFGRQTGGSQVIQHIRPFQISMLWHRRYLQVQSDSGAARNPCLQREWMYFPHCQQGWCPRWFVWILGADLCEPLFLQWAKVPYLACSDLTDVYDVWSQAWRLISKFPGFQVATWHLFFQSWRGGPVQNGQRVRSVLLHFSSSSLLDHLICW